jgi:DNA recombination protein RmuC
MSQEAALLLLVLALLGVVLAVLLLRPPAHPARLAELMRDQTGVLGELLAGQAERSARGAQEIAARLAVIDSARANIEALGSQVTTLAALLGNKQARGAWGEAQLEELVRDRLPAEGFAFQHTLSNGRRADCLIRLPHPPGPIVVDSKFPLEAYRALASDPAAQRQFAADVTRHVKDIAERYILPGETAEAALLFVPSEAIFAELHAHHPAVLAEAARRGVTIVSPTTLWAVLGTMRGLLRDVRIRAEAHRIKAETARLTAETRRLEERVRRLRQHFGAVQEDLREIETTAEKIARAGARVEAVELEDER